MQKCVHVLFNVQRSDITLAHGMYYIIISCAHNGIIMHYPKLIN